MRTYLHPLLLLAVVALLSGCGAKRLYEWGDYDQKLYNHYKNPAEKEEFLVAIKEAVTEAESAKRVPPGLYAEYGFLLFEQGNSLEAVMFYRKESEKWPESRFFMQKMIGVAENRGKTKKTLEPVVAPPAAAGDVKGGAGREVNK